MKGERTIRVVVADGRLLFREALAAALDTWPGIDVVARAPSGMDAVADAERLRPDVAVLSHALPEGDVIQMTYLLKVRHSICRVVIVTDTPDRVALPGAIEAGADGYITEEAELNELADVVLGVANGETRVPVALLGPLLSELTERRRTRDEAYRLLSKLTHREREVLALLAHGANNDTIAEQLVISPQTARTHIQNVLNKLGVHSRLQAAAFVNQNDILHELERTES